MWWDDEREDEGERVKRCPMCDKAVHEPDHTYCSQRCTDRAEADRKARSSGTRKEVESLMRQYKLKGWTEVD